MKLKHSLFSRRRFLNGLLGGWGFALLGPLFYPLVKSMFPPYREPDEVVLPYSDYQGIQPNSVTGFFWGNKPGLLKKDESGTIQAFVAVCSHLGCTVSYLPAQRKFFCACHEGWFDENGRNIGGPPPRPLRRLKTEVDGENLIIKKEGVE
ncbi:ubiquinol-cytochrome c reductase iron-sulfur subunit [Acidobacteriota bacterium]